LCKVIGLIKQWPKEDPAAERFADNRNRLP